MYELTDQVFNAIFNLDENYRKFFCLNKCEEHNIIYILKGSDGAPLMLEDAPSPDDDDDTLHTAMPVWCHERYAKYYLDNSLGEEKSEYTVAELKLELFKNAWIPVLQESKVGVAFMPLEQDKMFCIEAADIFLKTPEQRQSEEQAAQKAEAAEVEAELKAMEKVQNK